MNKYVIAALSIAVAIGPASALDVDLGGKVGGIGVGAGLGLGKEGASVGGGLGVDGLGRADVGGSVGTRNGSLGAGVGASGELGERSGGLSTGIGLGGRSSNDGGSGAAPGNSAGGSGAAGGTTGGSATGSGASGGAGRGSASSGSAAGGSIGGSGSAASGGAATKPGIGQARSVRQSIHLPRTLWPSKGGGNKFARRTIGYPLLFVAPLKAIPGIPRAVVRVCRQAIESAARPLGAVSVRAASAGPLSRQRRGALTAPIQVRIDYARQGRIEVRQARIRCRLDAAGRVIGVM